MDYNFIFNTLKNTDIKDLTTAQISDMKEFITTVTQQVDSNLTFDNILKRLLASTPDNLDKRTGSIIYDALAPSAGELAQSYISLEIWKDQTYILTAVGDDLDRKGEDLGIPRLQATKAIRIGKFTDLSDNLVNVPINSRFSVPESGAAITYYVKEYQSTGVAVLVCEQEGAAGNDYYGDILPLFNIDNLKTATITSTLQPARDKEDDDTYRKRILQRLNYKGFGGNIQDYKDYFINNISGTSEPQVYPVWNGGGTVKVSVLDSQYNPITDEFKEAIKEALDPVEYTGQGIGIAPIGHNVTVDTPQAVSVDITADVVLDGVTVGQIINEAKEKIEEYFLSVRKEWVEDENINGRIILRIFLAQIVARLVSIKGVLNTTNITLNGELDDLMFISKADNQYIPVLGEVTLTEVAGGGSNQ